MGANQVDSPTVGIQNPDTKLQWWGYVHTSGTLQAKRYFGPEDIQEANESPFCKQVVGPFEAKDRDEALEKVKEAALKTEE